MILDEFLLYVAMAISFGLERLDLIGAMLKMPATSAFFAFKNLTPRMKQLLIAILSLVVVVGYNFMGCKGIGNGSCFSWSLIYEYFATLATMSITHISTKHFLKPT